MNFQGLGLGLVMAHVKWAGCHKLEDAAFHMEDFPVSWNQLL